MAKSLAEGWPKAGIRGKAQGCGMRAGRRLAKGWDPRKSAGMWLAEGWGRRLDRYGPRAVFGRRLAEGWSGVEIGFLGSFASWLGDGARR